MAGLHYLIGQGGTLITRRACVTPGGGAFTIMCGSGFRATRWTMWQSIAGRDSVTGAGLIDTQGDCCWAGTSVFIPFEKSTLTLGREAGRHFESVENRPH